MKRQRGVSLSGLLMVIAILVPVVLLGLKVTPSVIEYFQILKAVKSVGQDAGLKGGSVNDIRVAYVRHMQVSNFTKVEPTDLEITKGDTGELVIKFAYQDKVPLFANVSIAIDYEGSSLK
jgi:Domain of unknown function (DUF4845)